MSARVVLAPIEILTAPRARSGPCIAVTTGDGAAVPAEQAEPLAIATPKRASAAHNSAARQLGHERLLT